MLLVSELPSFAECEQTLNRLTDVLNAPFTIENEQVQVTASIGVTLYPTDSLDPDTLLRHADQAMYAAKQAGRHRFQLFRQPGDSKAGQFGSGQDELQQALANREFVLFSSPRPTCGPGGFSAPRPCCAGKHPEKACSRRTSFLALFEQNGMQRELGVNTSWRRRCARWKPGWPTTCT